MTWVLRSEGHSRPIDRGVNGDCRLDADGRLYRYWTGIGWRNDRRYAVRFADRRIAEVVLKALGRASARIVRSKRPSVRRSKTKGADDE